MDIKKFKALKYGHIYVDTSLLPKGIYETTKVALFPVDHTIEKLVEQSRDMQRLAGVTFVTEEYINTLEQCSLEPVFVMDKDAVDFMERAVNAYWNAANTALGQGRLGDIEKENYKYQMDRSKEILDIFN